MDEFKLKVWDLMIGSNTELEANNLDLAVVNKQTQCKIEVCRKLISYLDAVKSDTVDTVLQHLLNRLEKADGVDEIVAVCDTIEYYIVYQDRKMARSYK